MSLIYRQAQARTHLRNFLIESEVTVNGAYEVPHLCFMPLDFQPMFAQQTHEFILIAHFGMASFLV